MYIITAQPIICLPLAKNATPTNLKEIMDPTHIEISPRSELWSEAGLAAALRPPRHLPVRLGGPHPSIRGQVTRGVPGGHRGSEEGQESA